VALVAFEIARRHQFTDDMTRMPPGVELHLLPSGGEVSPISGRYRRPGPVAQRIDAAYEATRIYLERVLA
jgi:NTE family protein